VYPKKNKEEISNISSASTVETIFA